MSASLQQIIDAGINRDTALRVNSQIIATRKQAIAYLDDIDHSTTRHTAVYLLIESFAYTASEAERVYSEWLEDVA